jgi:hypothetical protein
MMDIYNADGLLDRSRVQDAVREILDSARTLGTDDRAALQARLDALTDELAEGFVTNPLDAPDMAIEYINMCRPTWSRTPPLKVGEGT